MSASTQLYDPVLMSGAVSAAGFVSAQQLAISSTLSSLGYDRAVESLLYDSPVGRLLWASGPISVAGLEHESAMVVDGLRQSDLRVNGGI